MPVFFFDFGDSLRFSYTTSSPQLIDMSDTLKMGLTTRCPFAFAFVWASMTTAFYSWFFYMMESVVYGGVSKTMFDSLTILDLSYASAPVVASTPVTLTAFAK